MLKNNMAIMLCFVAQMAFAQNIEVRKINPPNLNPDHIGKHILCHRPMRHKSPDMEIQLPNKPLHSIPAMQVNSADDKIIVDNYGHGGSGWTLGPGATKYVISLLEEHASAEGVNKQTPIAIIGAGALGLFTSLELTNRGYTDLTIYAEAFNDLTSHNAGGLLAPVSMDNNPKFQEIINQVGIEAYKFYKDIALKKNKQIPNGARIVPTYFPTREESGLEPYVGKVMQPAKDVLVDFQNGTTHKMVVYDDGIFMDTASLMDSLTKILKKSKVKFVKRKINDFAEVTQNVIFNCTGNGAKALSKDDQMLSVQGHLVMLKDQNPKDIDYMMLFYFDNAKTKNNQNVKRSFYIFPKKLLHAKPRDVGVVGGTFVEGADKSTPNEEEFEIMLEGARRFYGHTKDTTVAIPSK